MDNKSQSIVNSLVELDRTRKNAQAAADALRETDRWINLTQCIDDLFETGDLDQLCSNIEGMDQCLISLIHLSDYDERRKQVDKYKNNLESLIAPKLIQSLDELSLSMMMMMTNDNVNIIDDPRITSIQYEDDKLNGSTHHLINLLHRIGRDDAARNYYVNWLKEQITGFWNRSTAKSTESATTSTTTLSDSSMIVLPSVIQKLTQYKSMVFTSSERSKLNCLPIFTDNEHIPDMNSSMINDVIYFYALLICFFKGQLNAKLFFHLQEEQSLHNHHHQHHQQQKSQQSYPIELLMNFTNSLESFKSFQTFTNSILNYQLIGCLFRITIGCLQCFEELLIPFYLHTTQETDCSIVNNNNLVDNTKVIHTSDNLKTGFIRLIQVFINPFINLPELFTNYIRKQFDYKLNELTITVSSNPSDLLEKLNEDIVNQSLALFYDTIHLCFEEIGGIAIPFVLDIIQTYWGSLIAKWMVWNSWIEKQFMKYDSELSYHQAYGFMWILKFAHLTGDFSLRSNVFVEYVMSKCSDWLSYVLNSTDDNLLIREKTVVNSITCTDNQICMPTISGCVLHQLTLKQSTDCLHSIQLLAHSSNVITSLHNSTGNKSQLITDNSTVAIKSRSDLNGIHKSSSLLCRSTIDVVREIALTPIRYYLKSVPNLSVWFSYPNNGEECLPDLAYLPQDYMTQIGQYLFQLPTQLDPYLSMNELNFNNNQLNNNTIHHSLTASIGLTYCLQLGDSDVVYSMNSHRINDKHHQQQQQPQQQQHEDEDTNSTSTRKRQLSSNFNQIKQMIATNDSEISIVYFWLENLISVNVCDLIVNTILQIGMNRSEVQLSSLSSSSRPTTTTVSSKTSKHSSNSLKGNTIRDVKESNEDVDDDDDDNDVDEDQPLLTKHGLKQLDVDLGYLFSMLHDLGVNVPNNLQTLRDLINCSVDQFPKLCADRPPRIVNVVANFRGF
ncbi:Conserved oligomeric Golgi complex subunit 7 [Schistosoma japonicum]|uniref:Conserved oligomeric Golgi complex subunit 7 n=1 Tax=Schistosoma japonicum TaxID=6182 RepID=A0A4Z2D1E1_SCHJA|nr:Conserved oligomeric Golgi complex subunit 7 [Schistosoma japonicum]